MSAIERFNAFIDGVQSGKVLAPETVKQAVARHVKDLEREDIYFDEEAAATAIANVEMFKHVKGRWRGKNIELEGWQCFFIGSVFGWKWTDTNKRRFRYFYARIPRKNGKTLLAICMALVLYGLDGEPGAEIYLGATSQDQAKKLLFNPAKQVVQMCPEFIEFTGTEVLANTLVMPADFNSLTTVIRKPDDGTNPHAAFVDEYHEHDTPDQYETFDTGMGSREQPLLGVTTTAGTNLGGPCKEKDDECLRILDGTIEADTEFVLIYQPDEGDAWDDPRTLEKVNPNIGVSVSRDYLLDQQEQAKRSAQKQNAFRTKHLNQWVGARTAWLNMLAWQLCKSNITPGKLRGQECYLALDLATKTDLAALAILFPPNAVTPKYSLFCKSYAPEGTVRENEKYRQFVNQGWLTETPGNSTNFGHIEKDVLALAGDFNVQQVAYDPYQGQYLATRLSEQGLDVLEFRQTVQYMSNPMHTLEALVLDRQLQHEGNAALNWMMSNVMARRDEKDNIYPAKSSKDSPAKIDGAVASIMALALALTEAEPQSYLQGGELVVL